MTLSLFLIFSFEQTKGPFALGDDDDDFYSKGPFALDDNNKLDT